MAEEQPVKKVKHIDKMDDDTFIKHMNARHKGAAGMQNYGRSLVTGDAHERLLRAMHRALHNPNNEHLYHPNHEHGEANE